MIASPSDQHPQVLAQNVDKDRRWVGRVERHRRWVVDGDNVRLDAHEIEQLAHDLFGGFLLSFVDAIEIARSLGHRPGPLPGWCAPTRRPVPRDAAQTRGTTFSWL